MNITLKQRDIELALKMYLSAQGIILSNRKFTVEFTAGRKDSGLSATIDIGPAEYLADEIIKAVEATAPEPTCMATNALKGNAPTVVINDEVEDPEGEATGEVLMDASVPWSEESEVPAELQTTPQALPIFTPDAPVPIASQEAAPVPQTASVSLFA